MTDTTNDLAELCAKSGTKFILAMFVDLRGKPCAKLVPVEAVDELATDGVGFAGYAVGAIGQEPRDPDLMAIPDTSSFLPIPFIKEGLAIVHCDPHVEGKPWPFAPRNILRALIAQAEDAGFEPWVGAEVEYFLLKRAADGSLVTADDADDSDQPCYDVRGLTRMYEHLTAVSTAMNQLGWSNYANDHEDGNGQPVFPAEFGDDRGLGISPTAYGFVAGVLEHACALQSVMAPTVNSYKRTGATATRSGASWAPRVPTYGGNDRTHYIRIPDDQRVELRGGDGSANPYLAIAAALGAGLDGIKRSLDPGALGTCPEHVGTLPLTLLHAVDALEADPVVAGTLDAAMTEEWPADKQSVSDYFSKLKREEFFAWHSAVSPWEVDQYLTAF